MRFATLSRNATAVVAAIALAAIGVIAAPAQASDCGAGEICSVSLGGDFLRELGTTGEYFTGPSGTGDGYAVSVSRDGATHAYALIVTPIGAAPMSAAQTFDVTFMVAVGDVPTVADGRLTYTDFSVVDKPTVRVIGRPVVVSDYTETSPPVVVSRAVFDARVHFGDALAGITSASWSAPASTYELSAMCPQVSRASSSLGVTVSMGGPSLTMAGADNVIDTEVRLPDLATLSCWGVDADTFSGSLVVIHDGVLATLRATSSGDREYSVSGVLDCGGACVSLSGVQLPVIGAQTYTIGYAYRTYTATGFQRSYLAKKAIKRQGLTKKNTRNWAMTLIVGTSSAACVQNGNGLSALRLGSQGASVVCTYTISFQRKVGRKWKTQRVGGAYVAR